MANPNKPLTATQGTKPKVKKAKTPDFSSTECQMGTNRSSVSERHGQTTSLSRPERGSSYYKALFRNEFPEKSNTPESAPPPAEKSMSKRESSHCIGAIDRLKNEALAEFVALMDKNNEAKGRLLHHSKIERDQFNSEKNGNLFVERSEKEWHVINQETDSEMLGQWHLFNRGLPTQQKLPSSFNNLDENNVHQESLAMLETSTEHRFNKTFEPVNSVHSSFGSSVDRCTHDIHELGSLLSDFTSSPSGSRNSRPGSARRALLLENDKREEQLSARDIVFNAGGDHCETGEIIGKENTDLKEVTFDNTDEDMQLRGDKVRAVGKCKEIDSCVDTMGSSCKGEEQPDLLHYLFKGTGSSHDTELETNERCAQNLQKMKPVSPGNVCLTDEDFLQKEKIKSTEELFDGLGPLPSDTNQQQVVAEQTIHPSPFYGMNEVHKETSRGRRSPSGTRHSLWRPQKAKIFFGQSPKIKLPSVAQDVIPPNSLNPTLVARSLDLNLIFPEEPSEEPDFDDRLFPTQHKLSTSAGLNRAMKQRMANEQKRPLLFESKRVLRGPCCLQEGQDLYEQYDYRLMPPWQPTRGDLQVKFRDVMAQLNRKAFNDWQKEIADREVSRSLILNTNRGQKWPRPIESKRTFPSWRGKDVEQEGRIKEERKTQEALNADGGGDVSAFIKDDLQPNMVIRQGDAADVDDDCLCRSCSKAAYWVNSFGHSCFRFTPSTKTKSAPLCLMPQHQKEALPAPQNQEQLREDLEKRRPASKPQSCRESTLSDVLLKDSSSLQNWEIRRLERLLNPKVIESGLCVKNHASRS